MKNSDSLILGTQGSSSTHNKSCLSKIAVSMNVSGREDNNHLRTKVNSSGIKSSSVNNKWKEYSDDIFSGRAYEVSIGEPIMQEHRNVNEKIVDIIHSHIQSIDI
jgi:hypothetical protein